MRFRNLFFVSLLCAASLIVVWPAAAQEAEEAGEDSKEALGKAGFWEAKVPGGEYLVALSNIVSVSRHEYLLDGAIVVNEVTVDTRGQALARFYFLKPASGQLKGAALLTDRITDFAERGSELSGSNFSEMVVKKYPLTTHSKSIEYRLLSERQLNDLYKSVKEAWQSGRGREFKGR